LSGFRIQAWPPVGSEIAAKLFIVDTASSIVLKPHIVEIVAVLAPGKLSELTDPRLRKD
jgi:hypothetical protein